MKKNFGKDKYDLNKCADNMIDRIMACVNEKMRDVPRIKSAIVDSINDDKTVNVKLPGDNENIYTHIQNQSIYQNLQSGDLVKILLEDGSFSNCWIIARYPKQGGNETDVVFNNIGV